MQSVRIEHLTGHSLLNLHPFDLDLGSQITVVHGDNAQGKTNFIEAVHLALRMTPFRRKRVRDLILVGADSARLEADVSLPSGSRHVSLRLAGDSKTVRVDGKTSSRVPSFKSEALVVLFVPDDLLIVKGVPALRRAFLDNAISNLYDRYRTIVSDYKKVVLQKNRLLASSHSRLDEVRAWNARQVELGAKIVAARARFVRKFNGQYGEFFRQVSDSSVVADIKYTPKLGHATELEGKPLRTAFQTLLDEHLAQERAAGRTLYGPHLDMVEFLVDGRPAATYASQGQQRIIVLALKFLELHVVLAERGIVPMFLLDDVTSELDATRNALLMQKILDVGCQVFVTTTGIDYLPFKPGSDVRYFEIVEGNIRTKV